MDSIRILKKSDIIIITVAIIIAAVFFALPLLNNGDDKKVCVTLSDGTNEYLDLSDDNEYIYESDFGTNIVKIEGCAVSVSYSDCKNQICVNHGPISEIGDTICCLPHRFAVTIVGDGNGK